MSESKTQDLIRKLPARPVRDVALALVKAAETTGPVGPLQCHLVSGAMFTGWLVSGYKERESITSVLMQLTGPNSLPGTEIAYINLNEVVSLTIQDLNIAVKYLGFGKTDELDVKEPAPRLQILREMQKTLDEVQKAWNGALSVELDGDFLPKADPRTLVGVGDFIGVFTSTMRQLGKDNFSRDEISKRVKKIRISLGSENALQLTGNVLTVRCAFSGPASARFTQTSLKEEIEKLF